MRRVSHRVRSSLTVRGRCLLAAGATLLTLGVLLGERALVQVALFALCLPLLSALTVARARFRVAARRTLTPARVPLGADADVTLEVTNTERRRGGSWTLTERLPRELGREPTFAVDGLRPGATVRLHYRVHGARRGRYPLGPLHLSLVDPFGLVSRSVSGIDVGSLLVVPRVHPLPPTATDGSDGSGSSGRRSLPVPGEDDVSTRAYRSGDDLRKVHWRATARAGEMMVRLEERPWRAGATIVLDTRGLDPGPTAYLEWLVEVAAGIGTALIRSGAAVRLITGTGGSVPPPGPGGLSAEELLDVLAEVAPAPAGRSTPVDALTDGADRGTVLALLGVVGLDDVVGLTLARPDVGLAVLADGGSAAAALLRAEGWRVVGATAGHTVAQVWTELTAGDRWQQVPG